MPPSPKGRGGKEGKVIPVTSHEGPQSCDMSRLPHFLDSRLTDGSEVVSLTRWLASRPLRVDPRATVQPGGFGQLKNPMTSFRIEHTTFRLVA
jgi:hypothetical protein